MSLIRDPFLITHLPKGNLERGRPVKFFTVNRMLYKCTLEIKVKLRRSDEELAKLQTLLTLTTTESEKYLVLTANVTRCPEFNLFHCLPLDSV